MIRCLLFALLIALAPFNLDAQNQQGVQPKKIIRKVKTSDLVEVNGIYQYNGLPYTGLSMDLFPNNSKMQEMNWLDGLLEGTKTEYFNNGGVRTILNFKAGKRHGYFIYYHENGKVMLTGNYFEDLLDSTINAFYKNGKPKYIQTYEKGVKVGKSILFYSNGNVEQQSMLVNGLPEGPIITYYEAGNIRQEAYYKHGVREGPTRSYHLTGLIAEESYYKNGYKDSTSKYWDNVFGSLMKIENYKEGKKNGELITFNESGDTLTIFTYKNDVLNGPYRKYFSGVVEFGKKNNGKKKKYDPKKSDKRFIHGLDEYGTYADGKLDGVFKTGLCNKEFHTEGFYSNGIMVGEWRYFNEKGKVVLYEKYSETGELIEQKPKLKLKKEEEEDNESEE